MLALYKLQIKVLFKNPFLIFDFLFAFIFILIFGSILQSNIFFDEQIKIIQMTQLSGFILGMIILNSGMYSFGFSFFTMKESILLKRIGSTKIKKSEAIFAFIISGFTILFLVIIWVFFLVWIFGLSKVIPKIYWENIKFGALFFGIALGAISSYLIAFFFVSISSNSEIYNTITTLYFFIAIFLSGGLNVNNVESVAWMEYISWLTPVGWNSTFLSHSMLGYDVWNLSGYFIDVPILNNTRELVVVKEKVNSWEATLDIFMPIIFSIAAILATLKTFKWDN